MIGLPLDNHDLACLSTIVPGPRVADDELARGVAAGDQSAPAAKAAPPASTP